MGMESRLGLMEHLTKANGSITKLTGKVLSITSMAMSTLEIGGLIELMDTENISTITAHIIKVNGRMICNNEIN